VQENKHFGFVPRTVMNEMFNRNANGVRADGVGVK
jgi:hypothetical protein